MPKPPERIPFSGGFLHLYTTFYTTTDELRQGKDVVCDVSTSPPAACGEAIRQLSLQQKTEIIKRKKNEIIQAKNNVFCLAQKKGYKATKKLVKSIDRKTISMEISSTFGIASCYDELYCMWHNSVHWVMMLGKRVMLMQRKELADKI
jgi:hypothetical protein